MSHFVYFTTPILPHFDLTEMSVRACDSWYAKKGWHHGIIGWSFFPLRDTYNNDTAFYHWYLRSDETMKGHAWFLAQLREGLSDFLEFKMRDAGSFRQRWVLPLKIFLSWPGRPLSWILHIFIKHGVNECTCKLLFSDAKTSSHVKFNASTS